MGETIQHGQDLTPSPQSRESKRRRAAAMCWIIAVVAFGGYIVESIFVALTLGYIDNRNMTLPFLLLYGVGMAAIYGLFGIPTEARFLRRKLPFRRKIWHVLYYFAVVFLTISVAECLFGLFVEAFFDITWWDYSGIPLHITRYTSVPTGLAFTALIMAFMQWAFSPLYAAFQRMDRRFLYVSAILLMVLLSLDFISSALQMYITHDFVRIWRIEW